MGYHVYVVELGPRPGAPAPARCDVYVGSTHLPAAKRFAKHMAHTHGSRHVRRRGIRLRPDLARGYSGGTRGFRTRDAAFFAEHQLAKRLAARGHRVFGACDPRTNTACVM